MLTDQQIFKFQELYKNHFSKEISREEAYEKGAKLLRLVQLVYGKPLTKAEYDLFIKRRGEMDKK